MTRTESICHSYLRSVSLMTAESADALTGYLFQGVQPNPRNVRREVLSREWSFAMLVYLENCSATIRDAELRRAFHRSILRELSRIAATAPASIHARTCYGIAARLRASGLAGTGPGPLLSSRYQQGCLAAGVAVDAAERRRVEYLADEICWPHHLDLNVILSELRSDSGSQVAKWLSRFWEGLRSRAKLHLLNQ